MVRGPCGECNGRSTHDNTESGAKPRQICELKEVSRMVEAATADQTVSHSTVL